jgi:hypothetical protein
MQRQPASNRSDAMSLARFHQMGLGATFSCGLSAETVRFTHQGAPLSITTLRLAIRQEAESVVR